MKRMLALLVALNLSAFANTTTEDVAPNDQEPWGYTCTNQEVMDLVPNNMRIVGKGSQTVTTIDEKAIKLDRKAGTATLWVTYVMFPEGTQSWANDYGSKFSGMGYVKQLRTYNLKKGQSRLLTASYYNCSGVHIETTGATGWGYIVEGSIDESMLKYLKSLK